ncbi:Gag protein [Phytophthora palmivora]|uniref:Gag protein n=1 Tax=Phytophthora palmivora TaxID=4796 RepID=A0A2P4XXY7_9STRA|nr:Gag protein [Phytophthora palmivora]
MDRGEFPHLTDSQFESVRKMVGIFGGDALRSLAAATPAEQVERIEAFDTYERGLIAHVQGLQAPVAEMKPAQPKPLRLRLTPMRGRRGRTSTSGFERLSSRWTRLSSRLNDFGSGEDMDVHAQSDNAGLLHNLGSLCQQLRTAFRPANYEYRQRSRFLVCKQGKRELHEYIRRSEYSLHLWWGTPYLNPSR